MIDATQVRQAYAALLLAKTAAFAAGMAEGQAKLAYEARKLRALAANELLGSNEEKREAAARSLFAAVWDAYQQAAEQARATRFALDMAVVSVDYCKTLLRLSELAARGVACPPRQTPRQRMPTLTQPWHSWASYLSA
jgi:hypothetical protein